MLLTLQNSYSSKHILFLFFMIFSSLSYCHAVNKYSKEANQPEPVEVVDSKDSWKSVDKPFRLAKVNLIWAKAQKVLKWNVKNFFPYCNELNFIRG